MSETIWNPPEDAWEQSRIGSFAQTHRPEAFGDYGALWQWSVDEPGDFWQAVWDEFNVVSTSTVTEVLSDDPMPGTRWFAGASINYAEHLLRGNGLADDDVAVVSRSQSRPDMQTTLGELRDEVRRFAAGLRRLGVGRGDRVAAYLPNITETLVAFLATSSIGAIWSSCAPEFGVQAVLDRWSQIEPTVLLTIDGYQYGSKEIDLRDSIAKVREAMPSLEATVLLPYLDAGAALPDAIAWNDLLVDNGDLLVFEPLPFDHPLYVLYSSGTTGLPKPIVHGHGGVLLEHAKQIGLQMDLGPGDRFFWFSTTGWMMWNFVVSGLLVGSSIVLFDGDPGHPDIDTLWSLVEDTGTTFAGVSAPFIMACRSADISPAEKHDLSKLRGIGSTGAPLPAPGFQWIADEVGPVPIASISGGTDVCSAFLGGAPVLPVVAGTIACRQLGWSIEAFDPDGRRVVGTEGELVITKPAPSMPVGFWGDTNNSRYHDTYFADYPGVWRHGDWITIADGGTCVVSGRSDATLNRGGVRLGTADFYTVVEDHPAIQDSLVVHLEDPDGGLGQLLLFVMLAEGASLDDSVRSELASQLRKSLSPRHVPDDVIDVPIIPRTLSGKKLEVPVKRILQGVPVEQAASTGALADPQSLDPYIAFARSL